MRALDLASLEVFKAVVDEGGINRAAEKLHRVQSNVTTRIKQLEERLGTQLFHRSQRRMVLTQDGERLLVFANRLLNLADEAESAITSRRPGGVLRIGTMESTAASRLPPVLSTYHERFPDVRLELTTDTTGALLQQLRQCAIDVAFVAEPVQTDDLVTRFAFDEELVLITPPTPENVDKASAVAHHTIITFSHGCAYRARLERWLAESRVVPLRVMEFGSYHAIIACVAAGAGIAIVPRSVLDLAMIGTRLSVHALPPHIANAGTLMVYQPSASTAALEALAKVVGEQGQATQRTHMA
ncbi:LysR family transcriptional regulator [Mangrovitalea sediminis]|uniref:LysR family transcriptional regulator n=1 Tax=Mangrovitalea sediminis TaxID=1982043 RepID=UPI000BE4D852|nr:LysR family transcriptional regulator [Mangrovitalea sediminis]